MSDRLVVSQAPRRSELECNLFQSRPRLQTLPLARDACLILTATRMVEKMFSIPNERSIRLCLCRPQ
jgi:hypothetical protein